MILHSQHRRPDRNLSIHRTKATTSENLEAANTSAEFQVVCCSQYTRHCRKPQPPCLRNLVTALMLAVNAIVVKSDN